MCSLGNRCLDSTRNALFKRSLGMDVKHTQPQSRTLILTHSLTHTAYSWEWCRCCPVIQHICGGAAARETAIHNGCASSQDTLHLSYTANKHETTEKTTTAWFLCTMMVLLRVPVCHIHTLHGRRGALVYLEPKVASRVCVCVCVCVSPTY